MSKLPAFQFYPADWKKDPGIQALTFHERGVWFELLCLMHESPERGRLMFPNGNKIPIEALSQMLGIDKDLLNQNLTTLLSYGVAKVEPNTGIIFNKRMVEDEKLRQIRKECGKLGGNPYLKKDLVKQKATTKVKQKATPSSSSSSSTPNNNICAPNGDAEIYLTAKKRKLKGDSLNKFKEFWKAFAYPKGKAPSGDSWIGIGVMSDELFNMIISGAKQEAQGRQKLISAGKTPKWAQGWLNEKRWEDYEGESLELSEFDQMKQKELENKKTEEYNARKYGI